ncbi:MAG: GAF domain-containing protein [Xenococcaceae cyanobacterium]
MNKNFLAKQNGDRQKYQYKNNLEEKTDIVLKQKKTLGSKITAVLAIAMVTLPVLAIGIANYYFDSKGINKQEIRAKGDDASEITENKLAQRNQMLTIVLVSTGATALIVSIVTAFWTIRITSWNYEQVEKQAQRRKEQQKKLFQEFIKYLSRASKRIEILETTVEEAQKILECDRVLVYSLDQNEYGKIIAETVLPGWTRALDKTIADPSYEIKYIEKYNKDRFHAFHDIDQIKLPSKYLEQLEHLGVKANLAVPIYQEDKLLAILSAHHCEQPHEWLNEEREFLTELAQRVGFALDNMEVLTKASRILKQAETEEHWNQLLDDTITLLRQSLEEQDILNIAVEKVRQILACDRVVVYGLNQDNYGTILSESVTGMWTRSLGMVMDDPCFASRYIEIYRKGRVNTIDNVYEAGLTECYLKQLEKLEVKANLVVPILNKQKLFGLLIAHQCVQPRSWKQREISWLTQVANQVGFALDNAKLFSEHQDLLKRLETETKWSQLLSETVGYISQSLQAEDILHTTVEQVRQVLKCDRVVVYSLNHNNYGTVIAESIAPGWTRVVGKTLDDPCFAADYLNQYSQGRVKATDNIYTANMTECYLEQLENLEVKACLVTPILHKQKLFGLVIAHQCSEPRCWQPHEIRWLTQLSKQVGFALDNAEVLKQSPTPSPTQSPTGVLTLVDYEELPTKIVPVKTKSIETERNLNLVQAKLAETTKKIKQINQTSQKLLKMQESLNKKF